jgi:hypothetical protein
VKEEQNGVHRYKRYVKLYSRQKIADAMQQIGAEDCGSYSAVFRHAVAKDLNFFTSPFLAWECCSALIVKPDPFPWDGAILFEGVPCYKIVSDIILQQYYNTVIIFMY